LFLITGKHCPILFSNNWRTQYILEQWVLFEINLNHRRILKLNYVGNISGRKVGWIVKWYGKYGRKVNWIVKRFGKYGRKVSWTLKRYEKYGRNPSWIMIRSGKYRRKLWNDMENMEERQVE
jgi:hypothetical protein